MLTGPLIDATPGLAEADMEVKTRLTITRLHAGDYDYTDYISRATGYNDVPHPELLLNS